MYAVVNHDLGVTLFQFSDKIKSNNSDLYSSSASDSSFIFYYGWNIVNIFTNFVTSILHYHFLMQCQLQIVNATLDSYEQARSCEEDDERREAHHNWVDEVVRYEGKGSGIESSSSFMIVRPRPEAKDPSLLTRLQSFIENLRLPNLVYLLEAFIV